MLCGCFCGVLFYAEHVWHLSTPYQNTGLKTTHRNTPDRKCHLALKTQPEALPTRNTPPKTCRSEAKTLPPRTRNTQKSRLEQHTTSTRNISPEYLIQTTRPKIDSRRAVATIFVSVANFRALVVVGTQVAGIPKTPRPPKNASPKSPHRSHLTTNTCAST